MSDAEIEKATQELKLKKSTIDRLAQWDLLRPLLHARCEQTNSLDDLREIIQHGLESIRFLPSNYNEIASFVLRLGKLGIAFSDLWHRTKAASDSAKSFFFRRYAVSLCVESQKNVRAVLMSHLAL